jgi:hypothetical protein
MQQIIDDIATATNDLAPAYLSGSAANAAIKILAGHWAAAYRIPYPGFEPASMASDLDDLISVLTRLKLRISDGPQANLTMRAALGLD